MSALHLFFSRPFKFGMLRKSKKLDKHNLLYDTIDIQWNPGLRRRKIQVTKALNGNIFARGTAKCPRNEIPQIQENSC